MTTITLTPEQVLAVEQADGRTVRVEDPRSRRTYVLVEETHEPEPRGPQNVARPVSSDDDIPEGIRRSQDAFFHDLPALLKDESLRGKWIGYRGEERIGIAASMRDLIEECHRRGLADDQYDLFVIGPRSREIEEVDLPSSWFPC